MSRRPSRVGELRTAGLFLTLAALLAVAGEPRHLSLPAAGFAAITALYIACRTFEE